MSSKINQFQSHDDTFGNSITLKSFNIYLWSTDKFSTLLCRNSNPREAVRKVLVRALQQHTAASLLPATQEDEDSTDLLIGPSQAVREVHKRIGLAAANSLPVLVLGETGTGKEMVAHALHRHSARAGQPYVAVNCSAIPKELLESELFGHVRGAFTGATGERPGCFRAADGGVLLLDEIGDMALDVQARILRALQEGEVTPLGSHKTVKVEVRVVAATHRDLAAVVREGRFREELLHRLDVPSISTPPLRERLADIIPLAEHFLRRAAVQGAPDAVPKALSAEAAQRLLSHLAVSVGGFGCVLGSRANLIALPLAKVPHGLREFHRISIPFLIVCVASAALLRLG